MVQSGRLYSAATRQLLRASIAKPAAERRKFLRELQVKYHPDKQQGMDEASRALAAEIIAMVNEQRGEARQQAAQENAQRKRSAAYDALLAASPSVFMGKVVGTADKEALRNAIADAREAGVSEAEIVSAEAKLKLMR